MATIEDKWESLHRRSAAVLAELAELTTLVEEVEARRRGTVVGQEVDNLQQVLDDLRQEAQAIMQEATA